MTCATSRCALPRVAAALIAVLALVSSAAPVLAHATLVASEPVDGAVIPAAPRQLVLSFNEPVSALVLRLIGPDGKATVLPNPVARDTSLTIAAPPAVSPGTHVLSWRVVSLDGHPVGGTVVFSVGAPSAGAGLATESTADPPASTALWALKVIFYLGLGVGIGGSFFLAWIAPGIAYGRPAIVIALVAGLFAAPLLVGLQGADALELPPAGLVNKIAWQTGLETSFGMTAAVAVFALFAAFFSFHAPSPILARALSLFALTAVGLALALSGHASAAAPQWLMRPAVFVHAISVVFWVGCLVPLGAMMRNSPDPGGALVRFSRAIPWAVAALVLAGTVLAVVQVEQPRALLGTAYGKILCAKLLCVAIILLLAAWNRFYLTPAVAAGDPAARRKLAHSIAVEVALVIVIFGLVAAWRFTPPPRALAIAASKPVLLHIHTAKAMADVTLEPRATGVARASIVIMTGDFSGLDAKEVQLTLENRAAGIEAISRPATKGNDAIWRADNVPVPAGGRWDVRVEILVNDFEKITLDGQIDLRR